MDDPGHSKQSISGVVTTGIYCRPGCGARPNPANVTRYRNAAAAEAAGFRACHRCRPYRTSAIVDWIDGPELVCRAVRMVVDGALDTGTEVGLAAELGVSARHLRRLFHEHVGATPNELARSRRTHLARRLLDDTDLPIGDIAIAAGFGSTRQLHRALSTTFGESPSALRDRRRVSDRLVADGGLDVRLPHRPPLDWDAVLDWYRPRSTAGVESVDGGVYRRTILVADAPGVLEVRDGRARGELLARLHLPHWEGLAHLIQRIHRVFDLDADTGAIAAHLRTDPLLRSVVPADGAARPRRCWDPFEAGVRAILGQQVSVAAATTIAGRLVERHGDPVVGLTPMGLMYSFPRADRLAEGDLEGLGLTSRRASTVRGFATAVATGDLDLDPGLDRATVGRSLLALDGIGPWTASYLALRMGDPDAFPAGDLGLRQAVERLPSNASGSRPTERELLAMAEPWRPFRAYAAVA